jgi:hypothetical protein
MRSLTSRSHVEPSARATASPAAENITFWYWNFSRSFAVGFAAEATRMTFSRLSAPEAHAMSVRFSPEACESRSRSVIFASASGS